MPLTDSENNLILNWHAKCFTIDAPIAGQELTFTRIDTKHYASVVTL